MPRKITKAVSRFWWQRALRRNGRPWTELDDFPKLRPDEQKRQLAARLLEQVRYFASRADALPEWREAAKIPDADELWRFWPSLSVMSRETIRKQFEPQQMKVRFGLGAKPDSTGGSTGEPTRFLHDLEMTRAKTAANYYARLRMGWKPGMATIIVWGSERDIGKRTDWRTRLFREFRRSYFVDGYNLTSQTADRVLSLIRREQPVAMYGFSSMLEYVARQVEKTRSPLSPGSVKTAWNGGEMLFAEQSEVFRSVFGVPILNCYGGRELGTMACQFQPDMSLRVFRPWLFVEIVDHNGKPVGPGESGRMLWTSTICRGTPFLRYDIGDLATYDNAGQDESGIHEIRELHGRVASLFHLPNGRVISNLFWNHLFKEFSEVEQFQIVVRSGGRLRILLRGNGFAPTHEEQCRGALEGFLGDIPKELLWVKRIPTTAQGKLVQVIREEATEACDTSG